MTTLTVERNPDGSIFKILFGEKEIDFTPYLQVGFVDNTITFALMMLFFS